MRNATKVLEFGEVRVLVDPMLGVQGSLDPFPSVTGCSARRPLADLTTPMGDLVGPDAVVVTPAHQDHGDDAAAALLPRDVPVLTRHEEDAAQVVGVHLESLNHCLATRAGVTL